ncbi:MAG: 23S rRNA (guanosine(2251)-2'-O)-methyltransferase RlmB [Gammaproteobacteria bacterium]|nr:23S rRNA (guanosine(2251)-2'-O)-methyltransferase RlmB [Gammaproteobacteria bacterium]
MANNELVFGLHAVNRVLESAPERVLTAYVIDGSVNARIEQVLKLLNVCGCHVERVARPRLDKLADGGRHQGVVIVTRGGSVIPESALPDMISAAGQEAMFLILDGVQDPRNLGACLRVADGAGATAVIAPKNRAAGITVAARNVASGAAVPFMQVTNLARTLRLMKEHGIRLVGTSDKADTAVYAAGFSGPVGLVLGGEEKGMRRLTREACDVLVAIPMRGRVSSLNVSVAAGIVLYEALRQRL